MTTTTITPKLRTIDTTVSEDTSEPQKPEQPARAAPLGATNENPKGVSLLSLLVEDWRTHDKSFRQPGFWAVAVHRFGNWRMDIKKKPLRAPATALYETMYTAVNWLWGIDVGYTVKLGRRVRIWHHGGIVIGAHSIGDDVHIRQNTTLGILNKDEKQDKPTIGDRVDIGAGACVLGEVTVGDDVVIGANSVVVKDVPRKSVVFGVPARPVQIVRPE